ncbi:augmin complex subunit dgt3 [Aricia agestis]|uniref:augmin complex subunit dgt3 n=1 Tax=Aricia agestis TaxID=91739 RepID=UPI001C205EE6|nr:augmin complex subunit dgt3 [Aricia agestis]
MNPQTDITDEEFISFLNGLGVDTYKKSFEWMLNDSDFSGVLRWIYQSIDENNALSAREEYRYAEIEKKGKVLSQEALEDNIAALKQEYPGICLPGDKKYIEDVKFNIKSQNAKLCMLKKHEDSLKDLIKQNELVNKELNIEVTKLNAALQQSNEEQSSAKDECVMLAEDVETMTNDITNEVAGILSMYERCRSDKEISKKFFAFGPFDQYRQTRDVFKSHFDLYSSKMFYKTQCEDVSHGYLQTAVMKAQDVEKRLSETIEAYIDTKVNLSGEEAKLDLIKNFTGIHPSQIGVATLEANSMLDLLKCKNNLLEDEVLKTAVKDFVEGRTRYTLDVTTKAALSVREEVCRDLSFLASISRGALSIDRVLYTALRRELSAAQEVVHFAHQLRDHVDREAAAVRGRTKSMTSICLEHQTTHNLQSDHILSALAHILGGAPDMITPVKLYTNLQKEIEELRDAVAECVKSKEDGLDEFKDLATAMTSHIYDGCTRRPNAHGTARTAHTLRHDMQRVDARVLDISATFNTVKNGDQQNLRKLWQWFLTDPRRLLAAVKAKG